MAILDKEIQAFIVQSLACFRKPSLVVRDVKAKLRVNACKKLDRW